MGLFYQIIAKKSIFKKTSLFMQENKKSEIKIALRLFRAEILWKVS